MAHSTNENCRLAIEKNINFSIFRFLEKVQSFVQKNFILHFWLIFFK